MLSFQRSSMHEWIATEAALLEHFEATHAETIEALSIADASEHVTWMMQKLERLRPPPTNRALDKTASSDTDATTLLWVRDWKGRGT